MENIKSKQHTLRQTRKTATYANKQQQQQQNTNKQQQIITNQTRKNETQTTQQ